MKLIDADTVRRIIDSPRNKAQMLAMLEQTPTVEIIQCKDCKHRILNKLYSNRKFKYYCILDTGDPWELGRNAEDDNWFCADAERRQDG